LAQGVRVGSVISRFVPGMTVALLTCVTGGALAAGLAARDATALDSCNGTGDKGIGGKGWCSWGKGVRDESSRHRRVMACRPCKISALTDQPGSWISVRFAGGGGDVVAALLQGEEGQR
jgi:hypothetical protein